MVISLLFLPKELTLGRKLPTNSSSYLKENVYKYKGGSSAMPHNLIFDILEVSYLQLRQR